MGRCAQPADAAHHVFGVSLVDDVPARRGVRRRDGLDQVAERHPQDPHPVGVGDDLVFDREPADARHVGHSGNRAELGADVPVLDRAEPAQVKTRSFDRVPEDLTGRRGVGRQLGAGSGAEAGCLTRVEPLGHTPASFGRGRRSSSKITLIIEKPTSLDDRTTRTPRSPRRPSVSG